jgi:hypothetical protein
MPNQSCNCIICAKEFDIEELHSVALSQINITNFKVCEGCFNICDPDEDYRQVRNIVDSYNKTRILYAEVQDALNSRSKLK